MGDSLSNNDSAIGEVRYDPVGASKLLYWNAYHFLLIFSIVQVPLLVATPLINPDGLLFTSLLDNNKILQNSPLQTKFFISIFAFYTYLMFLPVVIKSVVHN